MMRAAITLLSLLLIGPQNGYDLFQKALIKERAEGKLDEAIQIYEQIIREFSTDRALAAKAQEAAKAARVRLSGLNLKSDRNSSIVIRRLYTGTADFLGGVSLDGRYISTVDWDGDGNVLLVDIATLQKRRLTTTSPPWSEWAEFTLPSADGRFIAYSWFRRGGWELRLLRTDRENPDATARVIYRNSEVEFVRPFDWTRDNKQILVELSKKDVTHQIAMVSASDGSLRVLKTLDWRGVIKMNLSPDGRFVAYDFPQREDGRERDIFILATDGSRETAAVAHSADDYLLGWTPDGKRILFASNRTGSYDAWMIPVNDGRADGQAEPVKQGIGLAFGIGFTKNGAFYYGRDTEMVDVYSAAVDFEKLKVTAPLAPVTQRFIGTNQFPAWSLDGKRLAYRSHRGPKYLGTNILVIRSMDTGEEVDVIPQLSNFYQSTWSSGGESVFVRGRDKKGRPGIYRVDIPSGNTTIIRRSEPGEDLQWLTCSWKTIHIGHQGDLSERW